MNHFKGKQFQQDVIIVAVGYYLRYNLSYREVQEILYDRGINVSHTTIYRWVQEYGKLLYQIWKKKNKKSFYSWKMDETYIKIKGKWHYLYQAIDADGLTLDIWLRKKRDTQAAYAFLKRLVKQFDEEEYPYILSDWEEPTSETAMDAGNKKIAYNIAEKIIDDTDDLSIINGINNQLGGNDSGAETLIPVLNEMGIHYAELDVEYYDNSKEYVVFNPKDIKIVNQKLTKPEQSKKFVSDVDIKSLEEKAIKTIAKSELIVKANNPVEAMQKLYNNDLKSAIKASFILYDLPEDKIDSSKKNVTWEDLVNIEKSYNVFSYYQNNLYGSELVEPDLNNPYQENTKILDNKATQKQPALSDQYKALHDKLKEPGANKQQIQEQLNKVKIEISQKTQQQLKDFAKANPDLKQPRVKKEQQALQR